MKIERRQIIAGFVLFAAGVSTVPAAEKVIGDPALAKPIVQEKCAACHGEDGNSPVPNFPNLAGQHPEYLFHELKEMRAEHRQSTVMPATLMSDLKDGDLSNLALYFAEQKPNPGTVTKPELLDLGKKIYLNGNPDNGVPSCDGCHEEDGSGSERFPRIAGQNVEYTLDQFKQYATDVRINGVKQMRAVAHRLTEQEIEALAQYLASLK